MKNIYSIFLLIFLILPISKLLAQDFSVKGGVTVEENGLLYVNGDVEVFPLGEIQNNGTIEVTGDWDNNRPNGDLTDNGSNGQRLIRFINTTGVQKLFSTSGKLSFHNFETTNNSATFNATTAGLLALYTGGGVQCNVDVAVENLDLNGGDLIMRNQNLTMLAGGKIKNYSPNNIIHFEGDPASGGAIRWMYSSTDSVYEFPLHHEGVGYMHATIYFDKAGPAFDVPANFGFLEGRFATKHANGNGIVNRDWRCAEPTIVGPAGLSFILIDKMLEESDFGFWEFTPYSDDPAPVFIGDENDGWQYDIRLRTPNAIVQSFVANQGADYMKIIKIPTHDVNGAYIPFAPLSNQFNTGNGWINGIPTSSGRNLCDGLAQIVDFPSLTFGGGYDESTGIKAHDLKSFSRFGQGGNGSGAGLPVELLYFDANAIDNEFIQLDWATATEINNEKFEILKSTDGINFVKIDEVEGFGTTSELHNYIYDDLNVVPNKLYYYRLNQIDFDGASELTYIKTAMITLSSDVFTISEFIPNPTTNGLGSSLIVTTTVAKELDITVYNTLGQIMSIRNYQIEGGVNQKLDLFDLNNFADGTYYAIIFVDNEIFSRTLLVTKN